MPGVAGEIRDRVQRLELPFNRYGVDPFGVSREHLRKVMTGFAWMYRHYFRVRAHGTDNVPARGRAMLIGNHSGGVALDGAMVITSLLLEKEPPRLAHAMAEKFLAQTPFVAEWTTRCGQFTGLPEHALRLLQEDRLLLVFPEGANGTAKLFAERHSLVKFGTGFMRLALQTGTPIVPFAFLGGGEAIPTVYNAYRLGRMLGVPYVPLTPYGVALPLPAQLDVFYGAPIVFSGDGNEDDEVIAGYVERVKGRVADLIELGKGLRSGKHTREEAVAALRSPAPGPSGPREARP